MSKHLLYWLFAFSLSLFAPADCMAEIKHHSINKEKTMAYGKELIIDLYGCNAAHFNRADLRRFFKELCELVDMNREDLHFWDYQDYPEEKAEAPPHLVGTSAVQFITTSDIVIHTLDLLGECYINLFTCKPFKTEDALQFCIDFFGAQQSKHTVVARGKESAA